MALTDGRSFDSRQAIDGFYADGSLQSAFSSPSTPSDKKDKEKKLGDIWEQYKGVYGIGGGGGVDTYGHLS